MLTNNAFSGNQYSGLTIFRGGSGVSELLEVTLENNAFQDNVASGCYIERTIGDSSICLTITGNTSVDNSASQYELNNATGTGTFHYAPLDADTSSVNVGAPFIKSGAGSADITAVESCE